MASQLIDPPYLTSPQHDAWFDAIVNNDCKTVREILATADCKEQQLLLHGNIYNPTYMTTLMTRHKEAIPHARPGNSWSLATASGAMAVIKLFVQKYNINIHQVDTRGDNAIHAIIRVASGSTKMERTAVKTYTFLCEILQLNDIKALLKTGNNEDLRPLELALLAGTFKLVNAIFSTKGRNLIIHI